jgi:hypothetical protein
MGLWLALIMSMAPAKAESWGLDSLRPFPPSATVLFDATVWMYYEECKVCIKPRRGIPARSVIRAHVRGIVSACHRFWPGEEWAMYRMLVLRLSEGNGFMSGNAPQGEATFGPDCMSVGEVRATCSLFPDLYRDCPRTRTGIIEKLESSSAFASMMLAGTLYRYDIAQGGDRIMGTLMYKMGATGVARALDVAPGRSITALKPWKALDIMLERVLCLRSRIIMNTPYPCGCEPHD